MLHESTQPHNKQPRRTTAQLLRVYEVPIHLMFRERQGQLFTVVYDDFSQLHMSALG